MNDDRDPRDERLAHLLRASQAEADPAVWARVRARVLSDRARRASPGEAWIAWWSRPAAVAAAAAALVVVFGVGAFVSRGLARSSDVVAGTVEIASLSDWLLAEDENAEVAAPPSAPDTPAPDSGGAS